MLRDELVKEPVGMYVENKLDYESVRSILPLIYNSLKEDEGLSRNNNASSSPLGKDVETE